MRRSSSEQLTALERLTVVMFGIYLTAVGVHVLDTRHFLYRNYLNSPVLAPIALIIGIVLIGAGLLMRD